MFHFMWLYNAFALKRRRFLVFYIVVAETAIHIGSHHSLSCEIKVNLNAGLNKISSRFDPPFDRTFAYFVPEGGRIRVPDTYNTNFQTIWFFKLFGSPKNNKPRTCYEKQRFAWIKNKVKLKLNKEEHGNPKNWTNTLLAPNELNNATFSFRLKH